MWLVLNGSYIYFCDFEAEESALMVTSPIGFNRLWTCCWSPKWVWQWQNHGDSHVTLKQEVNVQWSVFFYNFEKVIGNALPIGKQCHRATDHVKAALQ